jgi:N-acetylglutamate synthase
MNIQIRDFEIQDYDAAIKLWRTDNNVGLSSADNKTNFLQFLERNQGLSKVAVINGQIVGTALCGHDGRRGYLYHLYVAPDYRRKGIGKMLVDSCLDSLQRERIQKSHVFVFDMNDLGKSFWNGSKWSKRNDIVVFSKNI